MDDNSNYFYFRNVTVKENYSRQISGRSGSKPAPFSTGSKPRKWKGLGFRYASGYNNSPDGLHQLFSAGFNLELMGVWSHDRHQDVRLLKKQNSPSREIGRNSRLYGKAPKVASTAMKNTVANRCLLLFDLKKIINAF
ncbi:hypothetical protein SK128_020239 [Halocaridina rubra]|uniref:Uncharacterized protein n=1 Tax=Halocaridina rubra TaxID=373956 RepID=A0AAN8WWZ7_HALRR